MKRRKKKNLTYSHRQMNSTNDEVFDGERRDQKCEVEWREEGRRGEGGKEVVWRKEKEKR